MDNTPAFDARDQGLIPASSIGFMTHIASHNKQPSYLHSLLDNYTPSRNLRSEGQHLLRIPLRRSAAARRSFCFGAPTVWNSLNSKTREADSLESFKTRLKTKLFSSAFQWSICPSSHSPLAPESPSDNIFIVLGRNLASKSNSIIIIWRHLENETLSKPLCATWWSPNFMVVPSYTYRAAIACVLRRCMGAGAWAAPVHAYFV